MDYLWADQPFFNEQHPSYPTPSHSVPEQAYGLHNNFLVFEAPASETLPIVRQLESSQSYMPPSFDPSSTPYPNQPHDAHSLSDSQRTPTTTMGPPSRPRKRKAPTLRADAWEPYKPRIIELHIEQDLPLREVKDAIEMEFGFKAEVRQYRTRISQWGLDKNIKPHEMQAIVRKRQKRRLVETNKGKLTITVRDNEVEPQKIDRWMKRNKIPESLVYAPSPAASTPSAVGCWTISERGSPAPSLTYSVGSPIFPMRGASIAQSPGPFSPASSVTSVLRSSASTFTGQSPAPIYRVLSNLRPESMPAPEAFPHQSVSAQPYTAGYTPQMQTRQADTDSVPYRYRQADEERLRRELSTRETCYGDDHPETLSTLSELSCVLIEQGRYRSAEEMIRRLVVARQKVNGNDDDGTMEALDLLGRVLHNQGLYAKAEKLHRRTFESRRHILGDEHPSTLTSMANLASTYSEQGRLKEAEELEVQVMETTKRVLGDEHPSTLNSMDNLAATHREQRRLKEAEELGVQVMETTKRVLGDEHPDTLNSMANLALTYHGQGRWEEAEELEVQVMATRKRVLGKEHPSTLIAMHNLARTWKCQGRDKQAVGLMAECWQLQERIRGVDHPDTEDSLEAWTDWEAEQTVFSS